MKQIKLPILFLSILSLTACLEPDLPKCNDKESKQLLSQVVNQNLKKMGEREVLVSLKDIEEVAFNKHMELESVKVMLYFLMLMRLGLLTRFIGEIRKKVEWKKNSL